MNHCKITLSDLVKAYPDKPWCWTALSRYPITLEILQEHIDKDWWWWNLLSKNKSLTIDIVLAYPNADWNWHLLSINPSLSQYIKRKNPNDHWNLENILITGINGSSLSYNMAPKMDNEGEPGTTSEIVDVLSTTKNRSPNIIESKIEHIATKITDNKQLSFQDKLSIMSNIKPVPSKFDSIKKFMGF